MVARFLTLGASVVAAAGLLTGASASATTVFLGASGPPVHVIAIHSAFERALKHTSSGKISGVVPSRAKRQKPAARAAAAACAEPNCNLAYNGGPVQHTPHVYLLLWGPDWSSVASEQAAAAYLSSFYGGLGVAPQDKWSPVTSQYHDGTGRPTFTGTVFVGAFQDSSTPPNPVTEDDLATEAQTFAANQGITDLADAQVVVAAQSGTCFNDGAGNPTFVGSCGPGSPSNDFSGYCGWHAMTSGGVPFTNLPYQLDAGVYCGQNWINSGTAGSYDGFSTVGGHEFAETVTDPDPASGWVDLSDGISGGENADKCAWGGSIWSSLGSDPYGDVALSTGSFAMQSQWSNADRRCVMATSGVTVTQPGRQSSILGAKVGFQVQAKSGAVLSYRATGLPPGLLISSSTGMITGTPKITAGTFRPHVTASNYANSATVTFTWLVSSKAGPVKGYGRKCADVYLGRTRNGTKIDIWSCNGLSQQRITFLANGELKVLGKCITSGKGIVLQTCRGTSSQKWTRRGNGEYVLSGRCLTDPNKSTRNGTQLRLQACVNSPNQRWSLP